jgi:DNA-binding SARP family transcriptional activator
VTRGTHIDLCGRLSLSVGGRPVDVEALPGRQGRVLLAVLVLERAAPVSRTRLVDALWPESPPARPDVALSALLSKLRRALGDGVVQGRAELQLSLPAPVLVDVEVAEAAVVAAAGALDREAFDSALEEAERALAVLGQELLPGVEGSWAEERRRELADARLGALEVAARAALGLGGGRLVEAEAHARRAIELAPLRESATSIAMEVAAARGNVAEGLRVYDELRVRLRDGLGTAPAWPLAALHATLLAQGEEPSETAPALPPPPALAAAARTPMVGRADELARLETVLADPGRALVEVAGDAGIGKTRLIAELAGRAGGALVLWGRSHEGSLIAYEPVLHVLAHAVEHAPPAALRHAAGAAAPDLARLVPALRDRIEDIPEAPRAEPDTELFRLLEAVRSFVDRLAGDRGVVLVLDDLHWADASTLRVLRHLLSTAGGKPLACVVTYRPAELGREAARALEDLRRDVASVRVDLEGLDEGALGELLEAEGLSDEAGRLAAALGRRSAGNPLFARELLRHLRERGGVGVGDDPEEALERLGVPEGVRALIERRVERLDEGVRRVLAVAATAGDDVLLRVVEEASGEEGDAVVDALDAAVEAGLLRESAGGYAFTHPLVRATAEAGLSAARRARTHRRVGEALERLRPAPPEVLLPELARHFHEGASDGAADRALEYARLAGEQAMALSAFADAARHFERALEHAGEAAAPGRPAALSAAERCDLLLSLGEARWRSGAVDAAREALFAGAALARELDDAALLARAALAAETSMPEAELVDEELRSLTAEALARAPAGDARLRARLLARLAELSLFTPPRAGAVALARAAETEARRAADAHALVRALHVRRLSLMGPDGFADRLGLVGEMERAARASGDDGLIVLAESNRILDLVDRADAEGIDRQIAGFERLLDRTGRRVHERHAVWWRAMRAIMRGELEEGERLALAGFEAGRRARAFDAQSVLFSQMFGLRRLQGRSAELEEPMRPLLEQFGRIASWRSGWATILADVGRLDEARAAAAEVALDRVPKDWLYLHTMAQQAEVAIATGDHERCEILAELLEPYAEQYATVGHILWTGPVSGFVGALLGALGRAGDAERHLVDAEQRCLAMGARPRLAIVRADLADVVAGRDPERARELIDAAREAATDIGMAALTARLAA